MITTNPSICLYPWNAIAVSPKGESVPCCIFRADREFRSNSSLFTDFRNSPEWTKVRQDMLDGKPIPECVKCYRNEKSGQKSMRLESLAEKIPESVEAMPLEFLELTFSNLCNLACVGCHSELSSTWAKEDFRHGRLIGRGLVEHNYDLSHTDLSQLKFLKIIGGEPLMETKRFTDLLKRPDLDLTQLTIMFVTNGTILPNAELKELLDQCQRLKLFVSLDGIGSVNEWVRWPTKFDKIVENLNQFNSWWSNSNNVTLNIHMTVNVYNVWTLNDVGTFMYQNYPTWKSNFEWLIYPHWQAINIIPDEFKDALKSRLLEWEQTVPYNIHKAQLSPFTTTIDRLYDTPLSSWDEFKQNTQRLAKERNLNVIEMLPELVKATNLQL